MTIPRATSRAAVLVSAALLLATTFVRPASADLQPLGAFQVRGPGSTYSVDGIAPGPEHTHTPPTAVIAVAKGKTAQFSLQIFNNGFVATPYRIALSVRHDSPEQLPSTPAVYTSALLGQKVLPSGPDGFITASVPIGKIATYVVKVPTSAGSPAGHTWVDATLTTPDGVVQDHAVMVAEQPAGAGTTATDVFAQQGSQPYVGSSAYEAFASSPALIKAQSTTFTVKFQNNGPVALSMRVTADFDVHCASVVIKNSFGAVVTDAASSGNAATPVLRAQGGSALFHVTFTRVPLFACETDSVRITGSALPQPTSQSSVLLMVPYGN